MSTDEKCNKRARTTNDQSTCTPPLHRLLRTLQNHAAPVKCITFTPNGSYTISGGADWVARVCDSLPLQLRMASVHSNAVSTIAVSVDGQTVVTGGWDKYVAAWTFGTCALLWRSSRMYGIVVSLQLLPGGHVLAGDATGHTCIWKLSTGEAMAAFEAPAPPTHLHLSIDAPQGGSGFAAGYVWQMVAAVVVSTPKEQRKKETTTHTHEASPIPTSLQEHNLSLIYACNFVSESLDSDEGGDSTLSIVRLDWQLMEEGRRRNGSFGIEPCIEGQWWSRARGIVGMLKASEDGGSVAVCYTRSFNATEGVAGIEIWKATAGKNGGEMKFHTAMRCAGPTHSIAWLPHGGGVRWLASGHELKCCIWNIATKQCILSFAAHHATVTCIAAAPEQYQTIDGRLSEDRLAHGRIATGSEDGTCRLWELQWPAIECATFGLRYAVIDLWKLHGAGRAVPLILEEKDAPSTAQNITHNSDNDSGKSTTHVVAEITSNGTHMTSSKFIPASELKDPEVVTYGNFTDMGGNMEGGASDSSSESASGSHAGVSVSTASSCVIANVLVKLFTLLGEDGTGPPQLLRQLVLCL